MLSGEFDVFVCDKTDCIAYRTQGGPCIDVVPGSPDVKPFECKYDAIIGEISTTPLTRNQYMNADAYYDNYDNN